LGTDKESGYHKELRKTTKMRVYKSDKNRESKRDNICDTKARKCARRCEVKCCSTNDIRTTPTKGEFLYLIATR